jgi:hypothetical protein
MPDKPSRAPFRLREARVAPPGWPPDIAPNQIIAASHINAIRDSVYAWPGDVDGQNHVLRNVALVNATGVLADPTTAAGDLIARGAAALGRLPVGGDGQVLTADAAQPLKLKWSTPAAVAVASVFGRTGAIVAQPGDYTAAQVTNAISALGAYPDPAWLTSFAWSKLVGVPTTFPPAAHTHDAGAIVSGVLAPSRLGTGVADATVYLRGDGTWAGVAGGGGGGAVISVFGRAGTVIAQAGDYTAAQVTGAVADPTAIKGDLIVRNDLNSLVRLPVGATGQVLQADATLTIGMKWTTITAAVQTPWVTDHDGANYQLINVRRIGVGLALPAYPLDVVGDINYTGTLRLNGAPVSIGGGAQTPWTSDIDAATFTLKNAGRVGIGTATPAQALHVDVPATALTPVAMFTAGGGVSPATIHGAGVALGVDAAHIFGSIYGIQTVASDYGNGYLLFHTLGGGVLTERMRITAAGTVGIGTSGPLSMLDVNGDIRSRSDLVFTKGGSPMIYTSDAQDLRIGTNTAERIRITATGFVGIAKTVPEAALHIGGAQLMDNLTAFSSRPPATGARINGEISACAGASYADAGLLRLSAGGGSAAYRSYIDLSGYSPYADLTANIVFGTVSTERMRIDSQGNVGIGTTNPAFRLHVMGGRTQLSAVNESYALGLTYVTGGPVIWVGTDLNGDFIVSEGGGVGWMRVRADNGFMSVAKSGRAAYACDVAGDVNCTGAFRVNGTPLVTGGGVTTQTAYSSAQRTLGTNYQNNTGKPMFVSALANSGASGGNIQAYSDPGNPATQSVAFASNNGGQLLCVGFWVLPGSWYRVVPVGTALWGGWVEWT